MPYALRNTIVLAVLLALIFVVGSYFRFGVLPKKIEKIEKEVQLIETELQNTPDLVNQYNTLSQQLGTTQERWETRNKDIPPVDVTGQTYDYLNRIINKSGEVKVDMLYVESVSYQNYGYNTYNLKGESSFENLFRFIWYIENSRPLYKIRTLTLRGVETKKKETQEIELLVTYELVLDAYFSSLSELYSSAGERKIIPVTLTTDPFSPLILSDIPPNTEDLVEIERSDLKAVIPGKAFVVDQGNKMRALSEGDEVYLGYVTKINATIGLIECTLNKGGIIEKYELHIRYGQKQK
ncbi:MAG: ABC transporter C-terminal domain-containing protein [Bacteroidota bacterium]|nr:hypothetical protein [Bacteroidota bacterium]MBU1422415.1 hypothetical protein [Bacteroidota bacterium]MDI6780068.1 ABC transporter C-terminal domain-containing protein [Bacteroidota bacterium]